VDYTDSSVFGWYISNLNLNSDGERVVTDPVVRGDIVYFNTSIPTDATCSYGGTGWQMSVQYANGANPDPAVFDSNGDGVVNDSDTALSGVAFEQGLPAAPSFLSNRRYTPGTRTQTGSEVVDDAVEELSGLATGRLSWEELSQ
jgi:Tfp pilus tip-associated adhesin PilY1